MIATSVFVAHSSKGNRPHLAGHHLASQTRRPNNVTLALTLAGGLTCASMKTLTRSLCAWSRSLLVKPGTTIFCGKRGEGAAGCDERMRELVFECIRIKTLRVASSYASGKSICSNALARGTSCNNEQPHTPGWQYIYQTVILYTHASLGHKHKRFFALCCLRDRAGIRSSQHASSLAPVPPVQIECSSSSAEACCSASKHHQSRHSRPTLPFTKSQTSAPTRTGSTVR